MLGIVLTHLGLLLLLLFVVLLILFLVFKLKDDGSARILPLYAALYVIYLIMFIRMEHKRRKEGGADKQAKSPLIK